MLSRKNNKTFDNEKDAYNYALTLLNYRDYSIWELQERLKKCSVSESDIKAVIDKLCGYGFLDEKRYDGFLDEKRYAQRVYDSWLSKKYYGKGRLKTDLQKRNINDELIAEVTGQAQEEAELARCMSAADTYLKKKKINSFEDAMKVKAGLGRFLFARGSRGFAIDLIKKTMADKISFTAEDNCDY